MIILMRRLAGVILGGFSSLVFVTPAFATTIQLCPGSAGTSFANLCTLDFNSFPNLITKLINLALIVAVVIALFFLIYGGIKWVLSGGDKTAVEAARNHIVAAIVGLTISLLAFFILNIIAGFFNITLTNLILPQL